MKKLLQLFIQIFALLFAYSIYGQNFVDVTRSNDGQNINLSNDQVLEIKLPRTPSNGYTWCEAKTISDQAIQKSIAQTGDGEFVPDVSRTLNGKVMVGRPGTQIIRYVGASQGTTVLTLELRRPWIRNGEVIDSYTITVVSAGKYTGTYTPPLKEKPKQHVTSTPYGLPSSWDWRSQCTPIENQMHCGDCWAYATVGDLECNIQIRDGVTRDLSEEFITDCMMVADSVDFLGCNGGWCANEAWVASYTAANSAGGGAVYESDDNTTCNSTGITGTCGAPYTPHETIDSYADVAGEDANAIPPDSNIKAAIYNYGPVWVCADASNFSIYSGGIWTESSPAGSIDHAIDLVGWCDSSTVPGGGYWILRNSWAASWGMSGYMYISYGSDLIGSYADYIVYKGGIPHNIPPVANFGASVTSSCTGVIQFYDYSLNVPTLWHWDFGDGDTSNVKNPLHTYAASGTYTVTLKATNSFGNDTKTRSSYITINLATDSPTTAGASCTGPCSVTLTASGSYILTWYDAAGDHVNTGTSFVTPVLTTTTTYYVQDSIPGTFINCAKPAKGSGGSLGGYTSAGEHYLTFDCSTAVTLVSVTMYGNASVSGSRTISLENSSSTVLQSTTVNVLPGQNTYTLNFNIPVGTGLILACSDGTDIYRDSV
ncbi:MAG: C1 family peptidase, partial [Bacteroidales bacterium]